MTLTVHAGGKYATRDELSLVPVPEATESYTPVPHDQLADTLVTIGRDILKEYSLESEQYALAREGNQMFGVITFRGEHSELGLSLGFRKSMRISDTGAFQYMGLLYGKGVLMPRQLPVVKKEWLKPSHEDFRPRNLWSLYNGCTEAMKSAPPVLVMEKHVRLHEVITGKKPIGVA